MKAEPQPDNDSEARPPSSPFSAEVPELLQSHLNHLLASAIRLEVTREEQDAAAARAKASSQEIAQTAAREAAEETAKQVVQYLAEKKPDIASVANPLQGVMARALETTLVPMLQNLLAGLFVRPQPGQAPGAGPAAQSPQPQGSGLPPGWKEAGTVEGSV